MPELEKRDFFDLLDGFFFLIQQNTRIKIEIKLYDKTAAFFWTFTNEIFSIYPIEKFLSEKKKISRVKIKNKVLR